MAKKNLAVTMDKYWEKYKEGLSPPPNLEGLNDKHWES